MLRVTLHSPSVNKTMLSFGEGLRFLRVTDKLLFLPLDCRSHAGVAFLLTQGRRSDSRTNTPAFLWFGLSEVRRETTDAATMSFVFLMRNGRKLKPFHFVTSRWTLMQEQNKETFWLCVKCSCLICTDRTLVIMV